METLSSATLSDVDKSVPTPTYIANRSEVGIAHLGVGNFHRSHQAMYINRLLTSLPSQPWAIAGFAVREDDRELATRLKAQDGLYSLSLLSENEPTQTEVIGSLREIIIVPDDPAAALERLSDPAIRIVSLTVTESGYVEDPVNGRFASQNAELLQDIKTDLSSPRSTFGLIVAALRLRMQRGVPAFTVLSCDNIQKNGQTAKASIVAAAQLVDSNLARWIESETSFPNSMVDRITPRTTEEQIGLASAALGVTDRAPVVAEPFTQWVIEDDFNAGRPPLESAGVVFVDSVNEYEAMKLRLLNGAHQVLAYVGLVAGHTYVHEAMNDPHVRGIVERYWHELALPTTVLPSEINGIDYVSTLAKRFVNSKIADTLERLAVDSPDRLTKFVIPVLRDAVDLPGYYEISALILGAWARVLTTTDSKLILAGVPDSVLDVVVDSGDPAHFLSELDWLDGLSDDKRLHEELRRVTAEIRSVQAINHQK